MNNNRHSVKFITLGCKLNHAESVQIEQIYRHDGISHPLSGADDSPDLIFVNTCAVTVKAAAKSRHSISKLNRQFPHATIIAAGCLAQMDPDSLEKLPGVGYVAGTNKKFSTNWIDTKHISESHLVHGHVEEQSPTVSPTLDSNRSRPFVKIQDGCDQYCTYCIIPQLRGTPRSVPSEEIVKSVRNLIDAGAYEIVLTGIRIGSWGQDLPNRQTLADLLKLLVEIPAPHRIRLGSIEPWELDERLVEFVTTSERVCSHLHIPLQHTVPSILQLMNRPTIDETLNRLIGLRESHPNIAIGIDVICGFPGEHETEFKQLVNDIRRLNPAYIHTFGFSSRPGTRAAEMANHIDSHTIKQRVSQITDLAEEMKRAFYISQSGRELTVIPDSSSSDRSYVNAVSDNYLKLKVKRTSVTAGQPFKLIYR